MTTFTIIVDAADVPESEMVAYALKNILAPGAALKSLHIKGDRVKLWVVPK